MTTQKVNDIEMYYELHGQGPTLVLVAGLGMDLSGWFNQIESFTKDYQLLIFDNRGVGRSSMPHAAYSTAQMADDALQLLASLNIKKIHLLGHSMGGAIA